MVNWNEIAKRVKNDATYINLFCSGHGSLETLPVSKPTLVNRSFDSVLDFGCGVGRNLPYFKSVAKKVYAYDLPNVVDRCLQMRDHDFVNGVNFIKDLDEITEKIDIIFCFFSLQHFTSARDLVSTLNKLSRISDNIYVVGRPYMDETNNNVFSIVKLSKFKHLVASSTDNLDMVTGEGTYEALFSVNDTDDILSDDSVIFKSYADSVRDIKEWCEDLRGITHVSGLPRSGVFIGGVIAHYLNIPYVPFENLVNGTDDFFRLKHSRPINHSARNKSKILVVDDTSWSGTTIKNARKLVSKDIKFGALYCSKDQSKALDTYKEIFYTFFHTFEWNMGRDIVSEHFLFDMDGVICEDCPCEDSDEKRYADFLANAKPLYLPKFKVRKIVTARLERYRKQTMQWLKKHGVEYGELCMMPAETREEREQIGFGTWKALKYMEDRGARLFIESDAMQSLEINRLSKRPVLDVFNMRLLK